MAHFTCMRAKSFLPRPSGSKRKSPGMRLPSMVAFMAGRPTTISKNPVQKRICPREPCTETTSQILHRTDLTREKFAKSTLEMGERNDQVKKTSLPSRQRGCGAQKRSATINMQHKVRFSASCDPSMIIKLLITDRAGAEDLVNTRELEAS